MRRKTRLKQHLEVRKVASALIVDTSNNMVNYQNIAQLPYVSDIVSARINAHYRDIDIYLNNGDVLEIHTDFFMSDVNKKVIKKYREWYCKNKLSN